MFVILHQDMSWSLSDAKSMRFYLVLAHFVCSWLMAIKWVVIIIGQL